MPRLTQSITRPFPRRYHTVHQTVHITSGGRPAAGGALVMSPLPVGVNGQPYNGMDPSNPVSWVRPWNPAPGMIAYLNFDGARQQGSTPTGTQRGPQSNIAQRRKSRRTGRG